MLRLTAVRRNGGPLWFWGGQAGSSSAAGASRWADEWWLCRLGRVSGVGRVGAGACPARARRGRLVHAVRWFAEEVFRRRIGRQLNRGESVNDLRRHLWVAQRGNVHHRHHDDQTMQAHCHTLLTNACILWTTLYLQDAVDAHRADGIAVPADLIAHISPACFEHISPWGTYNLRRRRDPQAHPPPATQATRTPLTAIRGTIPRRFGAVTQATRAGAAGLPVCGWGVRSALLSSGRCGGAELRAGGRRPQHTRRTRRTAEVGPPGMTPESDEEGGR